MEEEVESRKMGNTDLNDSSEFHVMLLEPRPFRPFKTSEEYLYAMKEDLAEWLNSLYGLQLLADNFLEQMETGVILCRHANHVIRKAREYYKNTSEELGGGTVPIPDRDVFYRTDVLPETFHARDNISNFISWCRALAIKECLLFETDDLVLRKNERSFILCLLEVARRGAKFGMPAPLLVQMEQEIDAELANDDGYETVSVIRQQVVTNDLRSLHERVVELLSRCTCPSQFPMIRVADGKYRIGDTKVLIFVRILRSHVMVRVGGGWDTLAHYLDKHDPCRCKSGHRLATSAKLTMHHGKSCIPNMHVTYNRPTQAPSSTPSSPQGVRRASAHSSPLVHRYSNPSMELNSTSPPSPTYGFPPRHTPRSDDSSASNSSLPERCDTPPKLIKPALHSEDSSSDFSGNESPPSWSPKKPLRKRKPKLELQKDTLPSSWRYSPGSDARQNRLPINNSRVLEVAPRPSRESTTRLPSLSSRVSLSHGTPPTEKSASLQMPREWPEKRSQSSEDLYEDQFLSPNPRKNLVFHSRGSSPVNMKGQNRCVLGLQQNANRNKPMVFKRCDPVRHSYHHAPRPEFVHSNNSSNIQSKHMSQRVTPERFINGKQMTQVRPPSVSPDRYTHNGVLSLKKESKQNKKCASPVLDKLMQHRELCSDKSFLKKIENLIAEYESQAKKQHSSPSNANSFHKEINDVLDSQLIPHYPSRSLRDKIQKSPSKIPLPTWNSKVKT